MNNNQAGQVFLTALYHSHRHPPHAHAVRYRIHTSSWVFFVAEPPLCQPLRVLRPIVFLTVLYHSHRHPPHAHAARYRIHTRSWFFSQPNRASASPTTYSVSDSIVAFTPTPTPRSRCSISHTHKFMGFFRSRTDLAAASVSRPIVFLTVSL